MSETISAMWPSSVHSFTPRSTSHSYAHAARRARARELGRECERERESERESERERARARESERSERQQARERAGGGQETVRARAELARPSMRNCASIHTQIRINQFEINKFSQMNLCQTRNRTPPPRRAARCHTHPPSALTHTHAHSTQHARARTLAVESIEPAATMKQMRVECEADNPCFACPLSVCSSSQLAASRSFAVLSNEPGGRGGGRRTADGGVVVVGCAEQPVQRAVATTEAQGAHVRVHACA